MRTKGPVLNIVERTYPQIKLRMIFWREAQMPVWRDLNCSRFNCPLPNLETLPLRAEPCQSGRTIAVRDTEVGVSGFA